MTKLMIISRLWSHITDLQLYIDGDRRKSLEQIEQELDLTEYYSRPYADCDDDELMRCYVHKIIQDGIAAGKGENERGFDPDVSDSASDRVGSADGIYHMAFEASEKRSRCERAGNNAAPARPADRVS